VGGGADTLLPQVAHEELQADEGEHAEADHGQDHDVRQLLYRLDQRAHDGLQACGGGGGITAAAAREEQRSETLAADISYRWWRALAAEAN